MAENSETELTLSEETDGSVKVEGLKEETPKDEELSLKDKPSSDEDTDSDDDDESLVKSGSGAKSRSAKRRRIQAERRDENLRLIEHLAQQNQILSQQLGQLSQRVTGGEMAQLEAAMLEADSQVQILQQQLAKTVTDGDGEAHSRVLDALYAARRRLDQLVEAREEAEVTIRRQQVESRRAAVRPAKEPQVDPAVVNRARQWLRENHWYDPGLGDRNSRIAHLVDQEVKQDGFDPLSDEYYEELDRRLAEALPSVKNHDTMGKSQVGGDTGGPRRRSIVSGSGSVENAGSSKAFHLSADRVKAMKDAGIWDDPAARAKQIKYYQEYDRAQPQK